VSWVKFSTDIYEILTTHNNIGKFYNLVQRCYDLHEFPVFFWPPSITCTFRVDVRTV